MFVVGVGARKGGTGKTTISFNVGMEFARRRRWKDVGGRPVLFVDLDPQAIGAGDKERRAATTLTNVFEIGPFRLTPIKITDDGFMESDRVDMETVDYTGGFEIKRVIFDPDEFEFGNVDRRCSVHNQIYLAHISHYLANSPGESRFDQLIKALKSVGWNGLVMVDTPPLNVQAAFAEDALRNCDLVIPVLNYESYDQIPHFIRQYNVRFIVMNKVMRGATKERYKIEKEIRRFIRETTLDERDIIWISDRDVIRSSMNTGVPIRCRVPKPPRASRVFHLIAWRVEMDIRRREMAEVGEV